MIEVDLSNSFQRNLGWITNSEQEQLQTKTVAIAGLGGVGQYYFITLVRMGVEIFSLAEFDHFEVVNFNRQLAADISTTGRSKLEVMIEKAKAINPNLQIKSFPQGINNENISEFLSGASVYLDGLDFFAFEIRSLVFKIADKMKIPAVTSAPIGMGSSLLCFMPGQMSFYNYFGLHHGKDDLERSILFALGLTPQMQQLEYLVQKKNLDFSDKQTPSTPMACILCAGIACTQVIKILLGRGRVFSAPNLLNFDPYLNQLRRYYLWHGYRNPMQKIRFLLAKNLMKRGF